MFKWHSSSVLKQKTPMNMKFARALRGKANKMKCWKLEVLLPWHGICFPGERGVLHFWGDIQNHCRSRTQGPRNAKNTENNRREHTTEAATSPVGLRSQGFSTWALPALRMNDVGCCPVHQRECYPTHSKMLPLASIQWMSVAPTPPFHPRCDCLNALGLVGEQNHHNPVRTIQLGCLAGVQWFKQAF